MPARRVITQPLAARATTVPTEQVGRHATFIKEDVLARIAEREPRMPSVPGRHHVRPPLFVGVYGFF